MNTIHTIDLIAVNPKIRGGRPYILGTTVTVNDVAIAKLYHGLDADGIAAWYGLTLPQVYTALAYYYGHKDDIDRQVKNQIRHVEQLKEQRLGDKVSSQYSGVIHRINSGL